MKGSNKAVTILAALAAVLLLTPGWASAQGDFMGGDDPAGAYLPQMLIIIDTSCSMGWGNYAGLNKTQATRMVLIGVPACPDNSDLGILDAYKDLIHFGFATFDAGAQGDYPASGDGIGTYGIKPRDYSWGYLVDVQENCSGPQDVAGHTQTVADAVCTTDDTGGTPLCAALHDSKHYWQNWRTETACNDPMDQCYAKFNVLMSDGQENSGCTAGAYNSGVYQAGQLWNLPVENPGIKRVWPAAHAMKTQGVPTFAVGFGYAGMDAIGLAGSGGELPSFYAGDPATLYAAFGAIFALVTTGSASRTESLSQPSRMTTDESYFYAAWFNMPHQGVQWDGHIVRILMEKYEDPPGSGIWKSQFSTDMINDWLWFENGLKGQNPNTTDSVPIVNPAGRNVMTITNNARSVVLGSGNPPVPLPYGARDYDSTGSDVNGLYPFMRGMNAVDPLLTMCMHETGEKGCVAATCADDVDCDYGNAFLCNPTGQCEKCGSPSCAGSDCTCVADIWLGEYQEVCPGDDDDDDDDDDMSPSTLQSLTDLTKDWVRGVPFTPALASTYTTPAEPLLGDVFHSNPIVVPPPSSLGPDYLYETFYANNKDRPTMLYVGANDGMMHAFVAENPTDDTVEGKELWGFIPYGLLSKTQELRKDHQFMVDGSPVVKNVLIVRDDGSIAATAPDGTVMSSSKAYRTVLISGLGKGGGAYFAMDVTNPGDPRYLWEFRTFNEVTDDYAPTQCNGLIGQTWAKPVVGHVWVRVGDTADYQTRSVAIFPGGYIPDQSFMNVMSCVDFAMLMKAANNMYVVDISTGRLLKKFQFTDWSNADVDNILTDWNAAMAVDNPAADDQWNRWGGWSGADWSCAEKREDTPDRLQVPPLLDTSENCIVTEDDTIFQKLCSYNGLSCRFEYTKNKVTGAVDVNMDLEGCDEVCITDPPTCVTTPLDQRGKFRITLNGGMFRESVLATPAAFSTAIDDYITRIFVPTSEGRVWRVGMNNGKYVATAPEGDMVQAYTATVGPETVTYSWDVGREAVAPFNPVPWYPGPTDPPVGMPIHVTPTLAMDYERNLVLYFGGGPIDDLTHSTFHGSFFAVAEELDTTGAVVKVKTHGTLFGDTTRNPLTFPGDGERLYGKPIVLSGKVVFTSYEPSTDSCEAGNGYTHVLPFDNFDTSQPTFRQGVANKGPPSPSVIWTPAGPQVVTQTGTTIEVLDVGGALEPSARMMHWGKVL